MNNKGLGLLSGGLDSALAVRIMLELGIEVTALNFKSPFCTCTAKNAGCKSEAVRVSREFDIPIKVISFGQEYIDMVKNPEYGYGKNMNPCLDCRIMMFKKAKQVMEEIGASFIFTGEVIGQRPMSQRRDTVHLIERESGLKGLILRPLSAKLLQPTIAEKEGIVDREKLLNLNGRTRKPQLKMAETYGMNYPCPSGGCLLTERNFANRMRDLFKFSDAPTVHDVRLLRIGRHFRVRDDCKAIIGRNEAENNMLKNFTQPWDYSFIVSGVKVPYAIAVGNVQENIAELVSRIAVRYSHTSEGAELSVSFKQNSSNNDPEMITVGAIDEDRLREMLI